MRKEYIMNSTKAIQSKRAVQLTTLLSDRHGAGQTLPAAVIRAAGKELGFDNVPGLLWKKKSSYGMYTIPLLSGETSVAASPAPAAATIALSPNKLVADLNISTNGFSENLVPEKDPLFVPFGNFANLKKILQTRMFYPTFITGMSGNGKTFSVEQACAQLKREVIRTNFTIETDEDDLIGGFRLVEGETRFFKGPVIKAMEMGAVLLLDEIDLGNPAKIMCLQSILEGKGYFIKKTGEYIKPAAGFTVIATANTKGKGSDDGRFIGTNVLNEAFLERFPVTCEQEYPTAAVEKRILNAVFEDLGISDADFSEKLVDWADIIRKTFYDGGIDEVISTRRLVHIAKAYKIFDDRMRAIDMCINRFDEDTKLSFRDLYTKLDEKVEVEDEEVISTSIESEDSSPY
jgi:MoxR-like ATPase